MLPTAADLAHLIRHTGRVRILTDPSTPLADLTRYEAVTPLVEALRVDPRADVMAWMQWPDLWLELHDVDGRPLVTLGLLSPDWIRWNPHGDFHLSDPPALTTWLSTWTGRR
ncbi:hypothetical protein FHR83_006227 [Actinoplanes campanulatus]|uniref:Uncharacterized protein n=1 Tax=Actinoplanes campanulatus TaxID=113559 RepID=A0A7W5FHC2_9ACTN|nr:hypothetical protein [Actinoplanes campanulatus]MBB3098528.1 hypothetical protein [Actinoplanes campanulatus]GGN35736.1 hypothetical protein GCM10010109_59990 [Actinoplanes campanulatus]GID39222.1 hypothetical protein Aca09nite_57280 [Actinoplanes campanulatus]